MEKRLYRSTRDRMIWGVCGGLARYFSIDPTIVRVIFILLIFANGLGILAYLILAILMPKESSSETTPETTVKENVAEIKKIATELGHEISSTWKGEAEAEAEGGDTEDLAQKRRRRLNFFGIILVVIGILFLLSNFNLLWWFRSAYLWSLIVVAIGVMIIISSRKK